MQSSTEDFITMDIMLPALVPSNATISQNARQSYFDLYVEVNAVSSSFYEVFDCFLAETVTVTPSGMNV